MTRFARAKGSKSSNEKAPEDSTPWEVLKDQLLQSKKQNEDAKNREDAEKQRIENYEKFLKERKTEKKAATWCDFPESNNNANVQNTKKNKRINQGNSTDPAGVPAKKVKKTKLVDNNTSTENNVSTVNGSDNLEPSKKKKKNKQKGPNPGLPIQESESSAEQTELAPKKKKNKKNKQANSETDGISKDSSSTGNEVAGSELKPKKNKKNNKYKNSTNNEQEMPTHDGPEKKFANKSNAEKAKKNKKKLVDGKPVRRKEIDDRSFQIIINGKEVELIRFDGFPVMKKDAERLAELKSSMIKKGIPKSEVQRTMKLERRRAEKALARVRREVCYNCRKGGHNLSDCPDLKSKIPGVDAAEGVCFKCGSTEHRQFECKVQRDKEFRFATCFICKEPGHIARQCPDNPKGLYPNGGSCKLCGDVTHLRKDCPTANTQKEETSVKLSTLDSTNDIEDIGLQNKTQAVESSKKPKKIKF